MKHYTHNDINKLSYEYSLLQSKYAYLLTTMVQNASKLSDGEAKRYLIHGVCRRLSILFYSIQQVFSLFPFDTEDLLDEESLYRVDINLHAFIINVSGILDSLAWVLASELKLLDGEFKLGKFEVGIYQPKIQSHLDSDFCATINQSQDWYKDYIKQYRDRLAHRIPLYVPPAGFSEEDKKLFVRLSIELSAVNMLDDFDKYQKLFDQRNSIGTAIPMYTIDDNESVKPMVLHPQLICDFLTIESILKLFISNFLLNNNR